MLDISDKHDRKLVIYTNAQGMETFGKALDVANLCDLTDFLFEKNKINKNKKDTLKLMVKSNDKESFYLAKQLIKIIHDETDIY